MFASTADLFGDNGISRKENTDKFNLLGAPNRMLRVQLGGARLPKGFAVGLHGKLATPTSFSIRVSPVLVLIEEVENQGSPLGFQASSGLLGENRVFLAPTQLNPYAI